jgi:hypothetical protein
MCTGLEIAMVAGAVVSASAAVYSGVQADKQADAAADQTEADAAAVRGEAMVRARKIREAAKAQQSEAVAALAASGVEVQSGTAEQIQTDIGERGEEDALNTILTGGNASRSMGREASMERLAGSTARTSGYINAGSSVLSSVTSYQRGDWKRRN